MGTTPSGLARPHPSLGDKPVASRFSQDRGNLAEYRVLIVDEGDSVRAACRDLSATLHISIEAVSSFSEAQQYLLRRPVDLLLLDIDLSQERGIQQLEGLRASHPDISIVIATAVSTVNVAVQAIRLGASDFLTTPLAMEELADVLQRAFKRKAHIAQAHALQQHLADRAETGALIGHSLGMQKIHRIVSKVAFTSHPVLILGASGTGKELLAKTIHAHGPNAHHPFVPVYCNGMTTETMDRELFGYGKGTHPEAASGRAGLLVEADHGTVFFESIDELPLELQGKLVRVLQEREVRRVGTKDFLPIHARILASASKNLPQMQDEGKFRRDLFFRLNVVNIHMPSLAERREDIPLLTDHILRRIRKETGVPFELSTEVREALSTYAWPGNVRELESALERACVMASGTFLTMEDFPSQIQQHVQDEHAEQPHPSAEAAPIASIAELEKEAILRTLKQLRGDKLLAARLLGIGKTTLYRKLKEYGIDPPVAN